jgi:hypothetical protein
MFRYIIVFMFCAFAISQATVIGDLAASMKAREWQELNTIGFSRDFLYTDGWRSGSHSIISWSGKALWDSGSNQFFFIGSPHDNPFKFIIYSAETNSWRSTDLPMQCMLQGAISGLGCASHGYYNCAIDPSGDQSQLVPPGSKFFYYIKQRVHQYNIQYDKWTYIPGDTPNTEAHGGLSYFPERNTFLYVAGWPGAWQYNAVTRTWSDVPNFNSSTYHCFNYYNPVHKVVLFGGGNSDRSIWKMDASGNVANTGNAPSPIGTNNGHVMLDPVSGDLLLYSGGSSFHAYDVARDSWSSLPAPPSAIQNSMNDFVAAPVTTYGVIMAITYDPAKVLLYKHSESSKVSASHTKREGPDIRVRPNPFRISVQINTGQRNAALSIYNLAGQLVFSGAEGKVLWRAAGMSAGVYILKIKTGKRVISRRLLLQK